MGLGAHPNKCPKNCQLNVCGCLDSAKRTAPLDNRPLPPETPFCATPNAPRRHPLVHKRAPSTFGGQRSDGMALVAAPRETEL